ncbi:MAG TPA: copper ABC transporter permease [Pseudogracilibacillus sp.]|nr:copper ABC transporter permease [Pseudogracilibacillus sp.]
MPYIWKEWLEQVRSKGLWFGLAMLMLTSLFLVAEARSFPSDLGFEVFLLSLFDMNLYLIPLFAMFLASFSMFQEKELKTKMILLTKKESALSFIWRKSLAIQFSLLAAFIGAYLILAFFMIGFLSFHLVSFIHFLITLIVFLFIFNQIGIFLGTVSRTKMQLISLNILTWFFVVFLIDLVFLYVLPAITFDNLRFFSWLYFLAPMHTLRLYLEVHLGLLSMSHMSRLMEQFIFMDAWIFLLINAIVWPVLFFFASVFIERRGDRND